MIKDAIYQSSDFQIELPQYGTSGSPNVIDFAIAGTTLPLELLIPINWENGGLKKIESQTSYFDIEIKTNSEIIYTF